MTMKTVPTKLVCKLLRLGKERLKVRGGWVKNDFQSRDDKGNASYCLLGSIGCMNDAHGLRELKKGIGLLGEFGADNILEKATARAEEYLEKSIPNGYRDVATFNDSRKTRKRDVLSAITKAIKECDKDKAGRR